MEGQSGKAESAAGKGEQWRRQRYEKNHAHILHARVRPKRAVNSVPMPVGMRLHRPGVVRAGTKDVGRNTRTIRRGLLINERCVHL
jgi:hypothetical protein